MKKIIKVCLVVSSSIVFSNWNKELQVGFEIHGNIRGLKDGTKLYLIQRSTNDTVAEAKAHNDQFVMKGKVPNGTEYYHINLDSTILKQHSEVLLLTNNKLLLSGNLSNWPRLFLTGSVPHDERLSFIRLWDSYKNKLSDARKAGNENINKGDSNNSVIQALEKERLAKVRDFIKLHSNSLYIPELITRMENQFENEERETMFNNLSSTSKKSYFGEILKSDIAVATLRRTIKPGAMIPDFRLIGSNFQSTIHKVVKDNKLTLIDFWASWCGPCRQQIPLLKKVYNAFIDKGFNIVAIALNDTEQEWQNAVIKDSTIWINARDKNGNIYNLFNVEQIPAYILVDNEGKIISFSCTGSVIPSFGPPIKGAALYTTIDSLLNAK